MTLGVKRFFNKENRKGTANGCWRVVIISAAMLINNKIRITKSYTFGLEYIFVQLLYAVCGSCCVALDLQLNSNIYLVYNKHKYCVMYHIFFK